MSPYFNSFQPDTALHLPQGRWGEQGRWGVALSLLTGLQGLGRSTARTERVLGIVLPWSLLFNLMFPFVGGRGAARDPARVLAAGRAG